MIKYVLSSENKILFITKRNNVTEEEMKEILINETEKTYPNLKVIETKYFDDLYSFNRLIQIKFETN